MPVPAEFEPVLALLASKTGLSFVEGRTNSAESGIRRCMELAGFSNAREYSQLLTLDADAFDDLIVELTVGETYFFRDADQFRAIREQVIPSLLRERDSSHIFRVWSAGCASGEEPYSLAILFEEEGLSDRTHILATDISREALAKVQMARYRKWSLRGEGVRLVGRYLKRRGDEFVLAESVRRQVVSRQLNLALDTFPSFATETWGLDLVLCRNVMIYFDADTVRRVACRLHDSLTPGGWLIAGASDPPLGQFAPFEVITTGSRVFYRRMPKRVAATADWPAASAQYVDVDPTSHPTAIQSNHVLDEPEPTAEPGCEDSTLIRSSDVVITQAQAGLAGGDYASVERLTADHSDDPTASALHVRAVANIDTARAEQLCCELAARHKLSVELHYLHAVLLLELNRNRAAAEAMRRVLYLDRTLAIGHFTLGTIFQRQGDRTGAMRSYRNARELCEGLPPDAVVALSDGELAGRLAETAAEQFALLKRREVTQR